MEFINNQRLTERSITDKAQIMFISLWLELFNKFTIDIYRPRAMNSKSIIKELNHVIEMVGLGIWDESNIKLVCLEAIKLVTDDRILPHKLYYNGLKATIGDLINRINYEELTKVKVILSTIIPDMENTYTTLLIKGLSDSIKASNINDIDWFTRTLASELINSGYSKQFLYELGNEVFFTSEQRGFDCDFDILASKINNQNNEYSVILKITSTNATIIPQRFMGLQFSSEIVIESNNGDIDKFIRSPGWYRFITTKVSAKDPYSAAIYAKALLCDSLDLVYFAHQTSQISIDPSCLLTDIPKLISNQSPLDGFYSDKLDLLLKTEKQLNLISDKGTLQATAKEKIEGALRYYRLSKDASIDEHQFLNLWIALEYLMKTGEKHQSVIKPITSYVPKMLALRYINRLIRDLIENIRRIRVRLPENVRPFIDKYDLKKFIILSRSDHDYNDLLNAFNNNPLLEHRLKQVKKILSSSENISNSIKKNCSDMDLHLARMYRIRNQIIHSAARDLQITGIISNLSFYMSGILTKVLYELSTYDYNNLKEVFIKYEFVYDRYVQLLKDDSKNEVPVELIVDPLKSLVP